MPESATRHLRADRSRQPIRLLAGLIPQMLQFGGSRGGISVDKPDRIPLRSVVTVFG